MAIASTAGSEDDIEASALEQLREEGFAVVPGWMSADDTHAIRSLMDRWIDGNPDQVQHNSDDRIFGAEHLSPVIASYKHDELLDSIAAAYMGVEQKALFTMGNRLRAIPGKKSRSGGRWHRDRKARQFKSLVYLSDCKVENGAFCIVQRSAKPEPFASAIAATRFDFPNQRWDDGDIDPFLSRVGRHVVPIEGAAGTLVLFDSSLIHSGLPIRKGHRYALTNYYYAANEIDLAKMMSKFAPSVKPFEMPRFV